MRNLLRSLGRQMVPALTGLAVFTVLVGVAYPLATTLVAQLVFEDRADGSLVYRDGALVGSELIGQPFIAPQYLHPRPSAAGTGYDPTASSGSNLGPSNADLLAAIADRVAAYRAENALSDDVAVPVDAVTASGSGLDPHISLANARLHAPRIAAARGVAVSRVQAVIDDVGDEPLAGVLGQPAVNVLLANLALDEAFGRLG